MRNTYITIDIFCTHFLHVQQLDNAILSYLVSFFEVLVIMKEVHSQAYNESIDPVYITSIHRKLYTLKSLN